MAERTPDGIVEAWADILCPFAHVGLRRLAARRGDRTGPRLWVRAWPLEVVNGAPFTADEMTTKITALRDTVAGDLFTGFDPGTWPHTARPALALTAAAYDLDLATGETVAFEVRRLLFEEGVDIGAPDVVAELGDRHDVDVATISADRDLVDLEAGRERGVRGSPHFFVGDYDAFCPSLDIGHDDGELVVHFDSTGFEQFTDRVFGD